MRYQLRVPYIIRAGDENSTIAASLVFTRIVTRRDRPHIGELVLVQLAQSIAPFSLKVEKVIHPLDADDNGPIVEVEPIKWVHRYKGGGKENFARSVWEHFERHMIPYLQKKGFTEFEWKPDYS